MRVDLIAAAPGELADHGLKAAVLYLSGPTAASADDVVVVLLRLARDVGVPARRQIERSSAPSSANRSSARKTEARPTFTPRLLACASRSAAVK